MVCVCFTKNDTANGEISIYLSQTEGGLFLSENFVQSSSVFVQIMNLGRTFRNLYKHTTQSKHGYVTTIPS